MAVSAVGTAGPGLDGAMAWLADTVEMLSFLRLVVEICMLILGFLAAVVSATFLGMASVSR